MTSHAIKVLMTLGLTLLMCTSAFTQETFNVDNGSVFRKVGAEWQELDSSGQIVQRYSETMRNGDMIELHAINVQMRVHIYPDRILWDAPGRDMTMKGKVVAGGGGEMNNLTAEDQMIVKYLGWGYDATGEFADSRFKRKQIFQISGRPQYQFNKLDGNITDINIVTGTNSRSFSNSLSANVEGGYNAGLFSASVKVSLDKSESGSDTTSFGRVDDRLLLYSARMNSSASPSQQALNDLNTMDPQQLFREYGTHYINVVEIGGHLVWQSHIEEKDRQKNLNINTEVSASYAGLSGSASVGSSTASQVMSSSARYSLLVYGGGAALNQRTQLDSGLYTQWKQAVPGDPALAGFGDKTVKDGLVPIWKVRGLANGRAAQLQAALAEYIKSQSAGVFDKPSMASPLVMKNSRFKLKGKDGRWLGGYDSRGDGYYLTLGTAGVVHHFENGGEQLLGGEIVHIKTTQRGQSSSWSDYLYVCIGSTHTAYYYPFSSSNTQFRVWKNAMNQGEGEEIRFKDKIVLESVYQAGECLHPTQASDGHFLTTETTSYWWTISQE